MALQGQDFNESLESYRKSASAEELAIYEAKREQFALANLLIERRKSLHLTQAELSERSGVLQPEISRIESGEGNPTLSTLMKVVKGLDARIGLMEDDVSHAH